MTETTTGQHGPPRAFRALRHRNYRLYFIGQLISLTGTWMQSVAQGWLVLSLTDSPALLGFAAAANSFPILALTLMGGTVADRFPKQKILIITQSIAMLLAATLAGLTLSGRVEYWHVLLLAMLLGVVNAFDGPARQAFTVEMVGREDLLNAIALNSSIFNSARMIGPAVAGIVVAAIGEGPAFALNALSFAAVIASMALMRLDAAAPRGSGRRGMFTAGLRYIRHDVRVRALLLRAGAISFFSFVHVPLLPVFARDVLQLGPSGLGLLSAAAGAGALLAALGLASLGERAPRATLVAVASISYGAVLTGFTQMRTLPGAMLMLAIAGIAGVTTMALTNTLLQLSVPDELRGRVMSVFSLLLMGVSPLGGMVAGTVAELTGNVRLTVAVSALIGSTIALIVYLRTPQLRTL